MPRRTEKVGQDPCKRVLTNDKGKPRRKSCENVILMSAFFFYERMSQRFVFRAMISRGAANISLSFKAGSVMWRQTLPIRLSKSDSAAVRQEFSPVGSAINGRHCRRFFGKTRGKNSPRRLYPIYLRTLRVTPHCFAISRQIEIFSSPMMSTTENQVSMPSSAHFFAKSCRASYAFSPKAGRHSRT